MRPGSHSIGAGNCAEAVSILVAGPACYHSGCSRNRCHIDFAPRFPARSCTAGESPDPIADRRLCEFQCLPRMSSRKLRELARVVSSHHDAGGNATEFAAGHGQARARIQRARIQSRASRRQVFCPHAARRRQLWRTAASRPCDRFAQFADPLAGDRRGPHPATISIRLHRRRKNVGASERDIPASAEYQRILFHRRLEWGVHGLPCHAGAIAICRRLQMGFTGGRVRHRVRSLP